MSANLIPITSDGGFVTNGNISAGNIITGDGSGGNISGVDNISTNTISTTGNISVGGSVDVDGEASIGGNLIIVGNITFSGGGSITEVTSAYGNFYGNADGSNALYAGVPGGVVVPGGITSFTGDSNAYMQISAQNKNHGTQASMEYVVTGDLGTDTTDYLDLGFSGSTWDGTQTNSLGNAVAPRDGWLYIQGGGGGGNLILGTTTTGTKIKFNAGGPNTGNTVATIDAGGFNATGNVTAGHLKGEGGNVSNIQGANVSGAVTYATTANSVAGANVSGAVAYATTANAVAIANVSGIGNIATVNLTGSSSTVLYGNGVFAAPTSGTSANIANGNSNVNIATANGNVTISAVGNNVVAITGTGANITGTANISGNTYSGSNSSTGFILGNVNSKIGVLGSNASITMSQNVLVSPDQSAAAGAGLQVGGGGYILAPNGARVFTLGGDGSASVTTNLSLPNGGTISTTGSANIGGTLTRNGAVTSTAWGTAGVGLKIPTSFYTDNSSPAGTITTSYIHSLAAPTLVQSNAVTITNAATLFVAAPTGGSNATITNSFAMIANGNVQVNGTAGVITPNRPAFRVYGTGGQITSVTQVTSTNWTVDFNQGSYLNGTTGYFTAPVAGLYQVNLVARTYTNAGVSSQAVVEKNDSTVMIMIEWAANTTMNHTGGSSVVKLAVGDTLRFRVLLGSISFDSNDNWSVAFLG